MWSIFLHVLLWAARSEVLEEVADIEEVESVVVVVVDLVSEEVGNIEEVE